MSRFYNTDPTDPEAPRELTEHGGLRVGMAVRYVGHVPLAGPLTICELIDFGEGLGVQAVLNDGEYECSAENLEPAL